VKKRWIFVAAAAAVCAAAAVIASLWQQGIDKATAVPVFMYHHLAQDESLYDSSVVVTPEKFEQQLLSLKKAGYTSISLQQYADWRENKSELPEKAFLITFDDGYESNYTMAYPVLQKLEIYAVIFVVTDCIDTPGFLTSEQCLQLEKSGLISIQSHSASHANFSLITQSQRRQELERSQQAMHKMFGERPVLAVAWPYGEYDWELLNMAFDDYGIDIQFVQNIGRDPRKLAHIALRRGVHADSDLLELAENWTS